MPKRKNYSGLKFSRLTAESFVEAIGTKTFWRFQCDCGVKVLKDVHQVKAGQIQSCGCLQKDTKPNLKHGGFGTPEYCTWSAMRKRCLNSEDKDFKNYGGRGITIDPSWDSFEQFLKDMGPRPEGKTLDRENNDGPYCKSNCRWATPLEQANNRRLRPIPEKFAATASSGMSNRKLGLIFGVTHQTVASWKKRIGEE